MTRTIEAIIEKELFTSANQLVQAILQDQMLGVDIDELSPALSKPDYSEAPEEWAVQEDVDGTFKLFDADGELHSDCWDSRNQAIQAAWEDSGEEPDSIEALEFYLVSDWLADCLEEVGACIAKDVLGLNIWGRTESGQAMTMDSDMQAVVALIKQRTEDIHRSNVQRGYDNLTKMSRK